MAFRIICIIVCIWAFGACTKPLPLLKNFDVDVWTSDRNACKNERGSQLGSLQAQLQSLRGVSENDIAEYFGRPDAQVLKEKNAKVFVYYTQPGIQCQPHVGQVVNSQSVAFHFNSVGLMTELTIQNGNP